MRARSAPETPAPATSLSSPRRQRPGSLSGVAFAVLLLPGWFLSGGDTPDYTATDAAWTTWAEASRLRSGVAGSLILLAGFALLHFAATVRDVLGRAEVAATGAARLARGAFAGGVVGAAALAMAIAMVGAATSEGAAADPIVSKAVTTASAGPYLVAAMGFAALLGSAGLSTLRTGAFPRWTGITALAGSVAFLITFPALIDGTGKDTVFGYGFLPGILALVTWSAATSLAGYRGGGARRPRRGEP